MANTLKRWVRNLAHSFGYEIRRTPLPNTLESKLKQLFAATDIDAVFDVGGHHGNFGHTIRSLGFDRQIVSFEPVPQNFELLQARSEQDPNWKIYPWGLGASEGELEINLFDDPHLHSFATPNAFCTELFGENGKVTGKKSVPVKRLDQVLRTEFDPTPSKVFLKLDTQGWDLEVLAGTGTALENVVAIQIETAFQPIYEGVPGFAELNEFMGKAGFGLAGLFPFFTNDMVLVEADSLFVRTQEATPGTAAPESSATSADQASSSAS